MAAYAREVNATPLEMFEEWSTELGLDSSHDILDTLPFIKEGRFLEFELEGRKLFKYLDFVVGISSAGDIYFPTKVDPPPRELEIYKWKTSISDYVYVSGWQSIMVGTGGDALFNEDLLLRSDGTHAVIYFKNSVGREYVLAYFSDFELPKVYVRNFTKGQTGSPNYINLYAKRFWGGEDGAGTGAGTLFLEGTSSKVSDNPFTLTSVETPSYKGDFRGGMLNTFFTRVQGSDGQGVIGFKVLEAEPLIDISNMYQHNAYGIPNRGGATNPMNNSIELKDTDCWGGKNFEELEELPLLKLDYYDLTNTSVGFMTGTVKINGTPTRSEVILLTRYTFQEVGRVMSNPDGTFRFDNLLMDREYFAISHHRGKIYNMVAQDSLMPEVYKVEEEVPTIPPSIGDKDRTFKAFKAWKEGLETEKGVYTHGGVSIEKQGSCHSSAYACTKWSYEQTKKSIKGSANGYNTGVGGDYYNTRNNPIEIKEFALAANFILIDFMKEFEEWDS